MPNPHRAFRLSTREYTRSGVGANLDVDEQQVTNKRLKKTPEEFDAARAAFEKQRAARKAKHPKYKPKPFRGNPWKYQRVVCWDGDKNSPVEQDGTTVTVPVEHHNFRLPVVEAK